VALGNDVGEGLEHVHLAQPDLKSDGSTRAADLAVSDAVPGVVPGAAPGGVLGAVSRSGALRCRSVPSTGRLKVIDAHDGDSRT
jgi:hypothetical protein